MAKQSFIVKAPANAVRVDNKYILCAYSPYFYTTENDFAVIQFNSKKEMREAFAGIAEAIGDTFYTDTMTKATYVKIDAGKRKEAKDFMFLANLITPYGY